MDDQHWRLYLLQPLQAPPVFTNARIPDVSIGAHPRVGCNSHAWVLQYTHRNTHRRDEMDSELKFAASAIGAGLLFVVVLIGADVKRDIQRDEYCLQLAKTGTVVNTVPRCMQR